jgi:CheY-like chemotaxis protein
MARIGPIIIIEDDQDDQELMEEVFKSLGVQNQLKFFYSSMDAYSYLRTTEEKPFLILSDINLPQMSGIDLKKKINESEKIRRKSIPFIFLSTSSSHDAVLQAYENLAQGFFTKPQDMDSLKKMIEMILTYWKVCNHPDPNLI